MRVLVVEDEVLVRLAAVIALEAEGFDVVEAQDGASALSLIHNGLEVDALFTDVNMPGDPNGVGLALTACEALPMLRVLITSGEPAPSLPCHVQFLAKPYAPEDVAIRILQTSPAH